MILYPALKGHGFSRAVCLRILICHPVYDDVGVVKAHEDVRRGGAGVKGAAPRRLSQPLDAAPPRPTIEAGKKAQNAFF